MAQQQQQELTPDQLDERSQALFTALVGANRSANRLPGPEEHALYRPSVEGFQSRVDDVGGRVLRMTNQVLNQGQAPQEQHDAAAAAAASAAPAHDGGEAELSFEDMTEHFETAIDVLDAVLERVDIAVDEASSGRKRARDAPAGLTAASQYIDEYRVLHASHVLRPQLRFEDEIDNSNRPWIPTIDDKPHAKQPLSAMWPNGKRPAGLAVATGLKLQAQLSSADAELAASIEAHARTSLGVATDAPPPLDYTHPYKLEIDTLEYTELQLSAPEPKVYAPLSETPLTWVDSREKLQQLVDVLESGEFTEIAVDLEHHNYRSFQGFTCLMQLSTRAADYLIDTLEVRSHMPLLRSVFADPAIVKVFHGADSDVVWLQRDFGIYIVNLFDTGQATRVLAHGSYGLAALLKRVCSINVDKKYQLADWRIRPLPAEMLQYAREDTHYLLYVYDVLRRELIDRGNAQKNLLHSVLARSNEVALRKYEKELFSPYAHRALLQRHVVPLTEPQLRVFRALYQWRDTRAREEDESTRYILPNAMLFRVATSMPSDTASLLALLMPVPPVVRIHADELILLITDARQGTNSRAATPRSASPPLDPDRRWPGPALRAAPPSPTHEVSRLAAPSPPLTTEQLYAVAGWTDSAYQFGTASSTQAARPTPLASSLQPGDTAEDAAALERAASVARAALAEALAPRAVPAGSEGSGSDAEAEAATDGGAAGDGDAAIDELMRRVPRSVNEIFRLSNQNRKRNKEKKKLKDNDASAAAAAAAAGADEDGDGAGDDGSAAKRRKTPTGAVSTTAGGASSAAVEDTEAFLRQVGWLGRDDPMPTPQFAPHEARTKMDSPSGKGSRRSSSSPHRSGSSAHGSPTRGQRGASSSSSMQGSPHRGSRGGSGGGSGSGGGMHGSPTRTRHRRANSAGSGGPVSPSNSSYGSRFDYASAAAAASPYAGITTGITQDSGATGAAAAGSGEAGGSGSKHGTGYKVPVSSRGPRVAPQRSAMSGTFRSGDSSRRTPGAGSSSWPKQ